MLNTCDAWRNVFTLKSDLATSLSSFSPKFYFPLSG